MADGVDVCSGFGDWMEVTDEICRDASTKLLGVTIAEGTDSDSGYFLNNSQQSTFPYPHFCFYDSDTSGFRFNPLESTSTTMTGRKVCLRSRFFNGTENSDSASGQGCMGDSQPIEDFNDCLNATVVLDGGSRCLLEEVEDARGETHPQPSITEKADKPKGCYRMALSVPNDQGPGCFGWNPITPTGAVTNSLPVCENFVPDAGKLST